jgi:hypothetical protein
MIHVPDGVHSKEPAGTLQVEWHADHLASGIYYYRLETESGFVETRKMVRVQ